MKLTLAILALLLSTGIAAAVIAAPTPVERALHDGA